MSQKKLNFETHSSLTNPHGESVCIMHLFIDIENQGGQSGVVSICCFDHPSPISLDQFIDNSESTKSIKLSL